MQRKFVEASLTDLVESEAGRLESYLGHCRNLGVSIEHLAASYNLFVRDTMREQLFFERHRRYRHSTYQEVASSVYMHETYMAQYMYGLAVSAFLWPNHRAMMRFFEATLPKQGSGQYLEVGPGHGFYFLRAMELTNFDAYAAVDISPWSVELTKSLIASRGFPPEKRYDVQVSDFLQLAPQGTAAAVVLGEVLEHVEQPHLFLRRVAAVADSQTYIYISTCVNAPEIDHISLFPNPAYVERLLADAGLRVREQLVLPYNGLALEEVERRLLPINLAYVVSKS